MAIPLIDANVLLRHFSDDNPETSPRAHALALRIERGETHVRLTEVVLMEVGFTLHRSYGASRSQVADVLSGFVRLPSVHIAMKPVWERAFGLFRQGPHSLVDAYQIGLMERLGVTELISFDRDFDRIPGINRIEP